MDPFWYVLYTVFMFKAVERVGGGVQVHIWGGESLVVGFGAVVDDTTILRSTELDIQHASEGVAGAVRKVNGKLNAAKTHFLTIMPTHDGPGVGKNKITLEGKEVKPATKNEYVKLIGGNVNILAKTVQDIQEVKKFTAKLFPKLKAHPPSIPLSGWSWMGG